MHYNLSRIEKISNMTHLGDFTEGIANIVNFELW